MRVTREQAAENRGRILREAARLFREQGANVGVDALTKAAGLTHGGLYSQFGSKDHLMAEAIEDGYARSTSPGGIKSLDEALARYLSPQHRDNPGAGCFMASLGCEMPRQEGSVRRVFTQVVRSNVARVAALLPARKNARKRDDEALATIATMVGAMVLARAVDDPTLSGQILSAARKQLTK